MAVPLTFTISKSALAPNFHGSLADYDNSLVSRLSIAASEETETALEDRFAGIEADIAGVLTDASGDAQALIDLSTHVDTVTGDLEAMITAEAAVREADDDAEASARLALDARVTTAEGTITAHASSITTLTASVGDLEATSTILADAFIDGATVVARWGFNLEAGNVITSMQAIAQDGPLPISEIIFGSETVLRSEDFVTDTAGWEIDNSGNFECNNLKARGTIISSASSFFLVTKSTTQDITGNGTRDKVTWDTETSDAGGVWNTTDSRFTAPVDGVYMFNINIRMFTQSGSGSGIARILELRLNGGSAAWEYLSPQDAENGSHDRTFSVPIALDASDYIELWCEINDTGDATYRIDSVNSRLSGVLMQQL